MKQAVLGILVVVLLAPAGFCEIDRPASDVPNRQPAGIMDEPRDLSRKLADMRQISGEIESVELATGQLRLREIPPGRADTPAVSVYQLNKRDTAVTDPQDKQFLKLEDLQPGYHVTVDYVDVDGRRLARKIVVESGTEMRWAVGEIASIDPVTGTFSLTHMRPGWEAPVVTHYRFHPEQTRVVDLQGRRFAALQDLRPGDTVQVEFTPQANGERLARWIAVTEAHPTTEIYWASGQIESVDTSTGTLVVSQRIPTGNFPEKVYYVVDLNGTRVVDLRGKNFLQLSDLQPGDPVTVQFVESQGRRSVQTIVLAPGRG